MGIAVIFPILIPIITVVLSKSLCIKMNVFINLRHRSEADMPEQKAALWEENDYIEQQIKEIIEWANSNMSWGSLSGDLVQTLIASLKPEIDYLKVLSAFRATVLSSDKMLTRFKPSRRYGFAYMGKKSQFTTQLLIGVDVSGSISDREIQVFYSAINRFFKYGIQSINVQQFDSELKGEPIKIKKAQKNINIHGRGGTCFQPVIDYFAAHQKTYDGLIIFTDGCADVPNVKRHIARKMLWICNNKESYKQRLDWMHQRGGCCWIQDI
jgi:predicted metal-dependent peptidase